MSADPGIRSDTGALIELTVSKNFFRAAKALLEKKQDGRYWEKCCNFVFLNSFMKIVTLFCRYWCRQGLYGYKRNTALQLAAFFNQNRAVEILLARRANLELKDDSGRTALAEAARKGHDRIVKLFLEAGADVEAKDEDSRTPFDLAVVNDCNGFKIDDENEGLLPRMAEVPNERAVEYLLNDSTGNSGLNLYESLNKAIQNNNAVIVSLLLDYGADPDDPNMADLDCPMTIFRFPIHLAAYKCQQNVAKVLLTHNKRKANVNLTGGEFWTALHACISGFSGSDEKIKMFNFLVQKGVDPTIQGGHTNITPLRRSMCSCISGRRSPEYL
ncbi:ankyrin repeat protein [Rutstroemia sp. NJR-2017a BVV2]|nr:ankyrin repeat protein [Rutstroemia sp. NJR-2017a BVV2]